MDGRDSRPGSLGGTGLGVGGEAPALGFGYGVGGVAFCVERMGQRSRLGEAAELPLDARFGGYLEPMQEEVPVEWQRQKQQVGPRTLWGKMFIQQTPQTGSI